MHNFHTNFCGLHHRIPARVIRLESLEQAAQVISTSRNIRQPVNLRGAGHGCGDRNIGSGLLLINALPAHVERVSESRFKVSSSTSWLQLERSINAKGRAVPVLTNWPDVSVGGTLAAGGFGSASIARGAQADWVRSLHAILPDGSEVSMTAKDPRFALMTYAQGIHGLITEIELDTIPFPGTFFWSDWAIDEAELWIEALAAIPDLLPEDTQHVVAQARHGSFRITLAASEPVGTPLSTATPAISRVNHACWLESLTRRNFMADVVNPWADYVLPATALASFLANLLADLSSEDLADEGFPRLRILFVDPTRAPEPIGLFAPHGKAGDALLAGIGVYFVIPRDEEPMIEAARRVLARTLVRCSELGGRPYLSGWHEMSKSELHLFYPEAMAASMTLRYQQDPENLFNPGTMPPL